VGNDHVMVQEALLGKVGLRVDGFKVLQEFGGGRRGCSDHCPLWVSLTAEESGSQAQAVVDSIKKVAVTIAEAEVVNAPIDNRPTSTAFMSDTTDFNEVDEDYELHTLQESDDDDNDEEMACTADDTGCSAARGLDGFEDSPMPVLRTKVDNCQRVLRLLVDSGAGVNLINADLLSELGKVKTANDREIRIKVADGGRTSLNRVVELSLKFDDIRTDVVRFYVMQGLPFDLLIGNPTLKTWDATLSWGEKTFSFRPRAQSSERVQTKWSTFVGQHWRRPIPLMCAEEIELKPSSYTAVPISEISAQDREGIESHKGLITPCRSKQIFTTKFVTSYGYVEKTPTFVLVANFTGKPLKIRKGFVIGELHMRPEDAYFRREKKKHGPSVGVSPSSDGSRRPPQARDSCGGNSQAGALGGPPCLPGIPGSRVAPNCGSGVSDANTAPNCSTGGRDHTLSAFNNTSGSGTPCGTECCMSLVDKGTDAVVCGDDEGSVRKNVALTAVLRGRAYPQQAKECGGAAKDKAVDWKLFETEPLKSVDLTELKKQRTPAEVDASARVQALVI
jgi:hypothetical protein